MYLWHLWLLPQPSGLTHKLPQSIPFYSPTSYCKSLSFLSLLTFGRQGLHFSPMTWLLSLEIFPPALQSPEPYPPSCKLNLIWHRGVLTLHLKLWPQRWALLHADSQHVPSQGHIVLAPLWQQGNWGTESENFSFRRDSWAIPMFFLLYEKGAWEENELWVWFYFL